MTRKTRRALRIPEHAATISNLQHWYRALFQNLGWMVLTKAKGHETKIAEYKRGIMRLISTIEHVISEYKDHNRIHDLNVLHMHALVLRDFVDRTL